MTKIPEKLFSTSNNHRIISAVMALALVAGRAAAEPVGVNVNGTALDTAGSSGAGWAYDPATGVLLFAEGGSFTLAGTNLTGAVRIVVSNETASAVTLTARKLTLAPTPAGPYAPTPATMTQTEAAIAFAVPMTDPARFYKISATPAP